MPFELDPVLAADTLQLSSLELCEIRLMNDARFPWLILVPRRESVIEILDLNAADQDVLWQEIRVGAEALRNVFQADKLNIAALGNQVAQLHVHVIARFRADEAWPAPVWGTGVARRYEGTPSGRIEALKAALDGLRRGEKSKRGAR